MRLTMKKNKLLLAISALLLSSGLLMGSASESSSKPDNDGGVFICEDTGEEGPMFYAADYSTDITNEPNYSTQNSYTFSTMGFKNAPQEYRGDSVKVAVIDSGLNYTHEDFADSNGNQIIQGNSRTIDNTSGSWLYYQFSSGYQSKIVDSLGHGTNVASVIASQINALGCAGIAPNVELYIYKVTNTNNGYEWTAINSALSYCISEGIDVINMSFQAYEHDVTYNGSTMSASNNCSTQLTNYINSCYNAGITLVAAAGNYNTSEPSYPASNNHVISVGSLAESSTNIKAGYSNTYGIDLVAPGTVYVADKGTSSAYRKNSGTSFSAPIVTAAIALYKQQNPSATPAEIESALYASCDAISGNPAWAGNGRLNIDKFLGVESVGPTNIVVNNPEVINEELELEVGDTLDLDWTVNGVGTFDKSVKFSTDSGTDNVVSVSSSGKITAVGEGEDFVYITSTIDDSVYTAIDVTVTKAAASPTVTSVDVTPSSLSLDLNGTKTGSLTAVVNGTGNPSQIVSWTSSNTNIATVSAVGVVTAKAKGSATISATSQEDPTKTGTCTVTVTSFEGPTDSTQYSLITSLSDLEVGKSYLIASGTSGTVKTMSQASNNNNRPTVELTVSNSKLTRGSSALSVTLGGTTGAYTFKTDNYEGTAGYLNATNTTNSNYLKVVSTLDNYAYFTIAFSNSAAVITCTGKSSRNVIQVNTSGTPISCYSSGQKPVYLWKEVTNKTLSSISLNTSPSKTVYEAGEYFNPSGLVINRTYSDSSTDTYSYEGHTSEFGFNPSTSTPLTIDDSSVTVTYGEKTCSLPITVNAPKVLSSISVNGYKSSFIEGDNFAFNGTVTAHYTDSTTGNVTSLASFSGYNMTSVGNQTVTVSYGGKTATYGITVDKGTLSSISVSGQTTTYQKGNAFSFDGICTATFANGYQKTVNPTSVNSPDMSTGGVKTITVSFTYNGSTKTTNYDITVNTDRVVIEETTTTGYSVIGTITYPSNTQTISVNTLSISTSGYTTIESNAIRLGSGSNTGTVTVTSTTSNITKVVVSAKTYGSDTGVTLTVGGTSNTITSSYADYVKEYSTATNSCAIATTTSKKRAYIESITVYETKTTTIETDISQSEDCVGLETFISDYMHMDYVENLGYCSDSEHHYYSTAKTAFNELNTHQRSLFTTNSAYLTEWTRLSTWASKNGDSLNESNQLASAPNQQALKIIQTNSAELVVIMVASIITLSAVGGYFFIRRRKDHYIK